MKRIISFFIAILIFFTPLNNAFAISIPDENEIAKKFMKMVKEKNMILNDPAANYMVNQVGRHLMSIMPPQPFDYSFYIVDEDIFNAFASPAANIFFYRGLITSLDSIDELAGIMAHEIAHASSRHVSESIDRAKYINLGSLAGMLAGIIIGSQAGGETGSAVISGSMAVGQTAMLAFTRENETEADEKGIMYLKKSCFSPQGLLTGLMKIRAADFRGIENIPDYVKTHPGTGNRIAHVELILSEQKDDKNNAPCPQPFNFDMVKHRLLGLYSNIEPTLNKLTTQLETDPSNPALNYGIGLLYDRKLMKEKALFHLKKALSVYPFEPMIRIEIGRIYLENEEPQKAFNMLKDIESDPVLGLLAKSYLGSTYIELGDLAKAKALFLQVIAKAPEIYPKAYYHLADILSQEQNPGLSHYYLGVYYEKTLTPKTAKIHLRKALENLKDPEDIKKAKTLLEKLEKDFPQNNNAPRI